MAQNKCMYCGSAQYGKGCPYSGHGYHVHPTDAKKCIYCGSVARGCCCPYNPLGKVHVHGIDYNQMVSEVVDSTIITSYLMERLHKPYTEHKAYQLGLIDKNGNKIKSADTLEEQNALTLLDEYLLHIKQMLGDKVDMINQVLYIEHQTEIALENYTEHIDKEHSLKKRLDLCLRDLKIIINDSFQQGLQTKNIEKVILEAISEVNKM